jgi:hypothetical protein
MNVRFAEQSVRCRITQAELDRLMSGRDVVLEVPLPPAHTFRLSVRPAVIGSWQLASDPTGIWLAVPRSELESLALSLPSKEGLAQQFGAGTSSVHVSVEVDLRRGGS